MDFAAGVFYLSDASSPPMIPYPPPPLHTVYVYTVLYVYTVYCTYSHREKGVELTREKVRGATVHKAGSQLTT
jgi:hypothetical protein